MSPSTHLQHIGSSPSSHDCVNGGKQLPNSPTLPCINGIMHSKQNLLPSIRLKDPLLHQSFTKGKYTSYKILIETEHHAFHLRNSCIRRRFSELRWLCNTLQAHHKQITLPPIPSKKIWSERFNTSFVNTRMKEMEVFLNELIKVDTILSDTALHLFLQTDLTTVEMDDYLTGKTSDDYMEKVWNNHGHLHTANELGTYLSIATPQEIEMDSEDEMLATGTSVDSSMSTDFNHHHHHLNTHDDHNFPSLPKLTTTKSGMEKGELSAPVDNGAWLAQSPDLGTSTTTTTGLESNSSTTITNNPTTTSNGKQDGAAAADNINNKDYDNASIVTSSTDDSTRNSSPSLSDGIHSNNIAMSTSSDLSQG